MSEIEIIKLDTRERTWEIPKKSAAVFLDDCNNIDVKGPAGYDVAELFAQVERIILVGDEISMSATRVFAPGNEINPLGLLHDIAESGMVGLMIQTTHARAAEWSDAIERAGMKMASFQFLQTQGETVH